MPATSTSELGPSLSLTAEIGRCEYCPHLLHRLIAKGLEKGDKYASVRRSKAYTSVRRRRFHVEKSGFTRNVYETLAGEQTETYLR